MGALFPIHALFPHSCPCPRLGTSEGMRARMKNFMVATGSFRGYRWSVAANSAIGFGDPDRKAHKRPITTAGAFFVPAVPCYGGCAWETFGSAGYLSPVRQPAYSCHPRLATRPQLQLERNCI